jgi:hypothetical protein
MHERSECVSALEAWLRGERAREDEQPAFTEYGVECLRQIIIQERAFLARKAKPDP